MFKRDPSQRTSLLEAFFICVIIAGVAIIVYATGRTAGVDIGRDEISAREHYESIKDSALAACVDTEPTALRECVIEASEAAQNQSESRQDLYAQQDMSRWAFWMMIISGFTFLVTGLGIVWIRDTLVETRKAVRSADDAVNVTREIGEKQVRAYLSIRDGKIVSKGENPKQNSFFFAAEWKNYGQSPAFIKEIRVGGGHYPIGKGGVTPVALKTVVTSETQVSPSGEGTIVPILNIGIEGVRRVKLGLNELHVRVEITYLDVFNNSVTISSDFYITGPDLSAPMMAIPINWGKVTV